MYISKEDSEQIISSFYGIDYKFINTNDPNPPSLTPTNNTEEFVTIKNFYFNEQLKLNELFNLDLGSEAENIPVSSIAWEFTLLDENETAIDTLSGLSIDSSVSGNISGNLSGTYTGKISGFGLDYSEEPIFGNIKATVKYSKNNINYSISALKPISVEIGTCIQRM